MFISKPFVHRVENGPLGLLFTELSSIGCGTSTGQMDSNFIQDSVNRMMMFRRVSLKCFFGYFDGDQRKNVNSKYQIEAKTTIHTIVFSLVHDITFDLISWMSRVYGILVSFTLCLDCLNGANHWRN